MRDRDDLQKFLVFLRSHNPFTAGDQTRLRNTSRAGVAVIHAEEEGSAVIIFVRKAIETGEHDVLLVYHALNSHKFYMEMNQHIIVIAAALQALGADICRSLLFVHAMTGCDARSVVFGVGKTQAFKGKI